MAPSPQLTYLDRVVMELIETERTYVRDLRMIVEDHLAHIIDQCEQLSIRPEQVCALFGNIEDIYEFNSELLQDLDLCDNDPVAVARCFVLKSEYFEIYTQYCTNYPNSVAALTECMRNQTLARFFRERQASLKRSLPLGSYLLKPVQRILKYHLLLQEIAKHFDPQVAAGYEVVEEAIYTMTGVAWYINDMKRKHEHAVRLQEVQSLLLNWKGPDLTTYGELVLEGTFRVHRAKNQRTLFLFHRMLLITKRRGEHYVYKTHISCSTLMLIESAKDSLSFSVTHYKHPKQPHTVQAKTVEERKLWAHHIKRLILENHQAIIPQKAKDAILEMNPTYPPRYRYSPERLKKTASAESDERRRRSEPSRQAVRKSRGVLKEPEEGDIISDNCANENGQLNEDNKTVECDEQASADLLPLVGPQESPEPAETPAQEPCSDSNPPRISESREESEEETGQDEDPAPLKKPSPATPDSDSKTLSSSEESSEEEEEDVPNSAQRSLDASSILPSSVLDRAGAIAQHFSGSIKRGSLVQDTSGATSPPAPPRLLSRTGSRLSLLGSEQRLSSVTSDPPGTPADRLDLSLLSPQADDLFDAPGRGLHRRRDSTLSQQDQLLLGKIKSYYEQAENQSPAFSLQRRESLTYIPSGLVRSSVSRLNSLPREESLDGSLALSAQIKVSEDLPDPCPEDPSGETRPPRPHNPKDDEFRPSSEMIRIWQTMEHDLVMSSEQQPLHQGSRTAQTEAGTPSLQPLSEPPGVGAAAALIKPPPPRVIHLKAEAEVEGSGEDAVDRTKSKVLNLARQYSQRIKTANPLVRQRSQGLFMARKGLASVVEEKESAGKARIQTGTQINMRTRIQPESQPETQTGVQTNASIQPQTQTTSLSLSPVEQTQHLPPQTPPPVRPRSCSPSSPFGWVSLEDFSWPDVQQLRSRYSELGRRQRSPVTRTRSIPDQVFSGGPRRHSSWSPDLLPLQDVPILHPQVDSGGGVEGRQLRLHRANSLDLRLSTAHITELRDPTNMDHLDGYGVTAKAPLPNDPAHSVIIVEKLPRAIPEKDQEGEKEEGYVQIRSPTSREKICLMAVVDRCRAYQESDQYRCRTEPSLRAEHNTPQSQDEALQGQGSQQNLVKNLRDKFQSMS